MPAAIARGLNAMIDGLWLSILLRYRRPATATETLRVCRAYLRPSCSPREFGRQSSVASAA